MPRLHSCRGVSNAAIALVIGVVVLLAFGAAAISIANIGDDDADGATADVYVSLGDSVAAGSGSSDPATTSFAALVAADEDATLFNIAKSGATTQDVIEMQVPRALPVLQGDRARFVTIAVGGNDLAALIPNASCVQDPLPDSCPLDTTLDGVRERLRAIMRYLRDANARTPIVLLAYPNFFSGTGHAFEAPAGRVLPRLDDLIEEVAQEFPHTAVARPAPAFEGHGDTLTHVLDERFDPHPNDAGHRIVADAVEDALDMLR